MFHHVFLSGAPGTAAAERPRGQLQRGAVISYRIILLRPIWLPVSHYLLFLMFYVCTVLLRLKNFRE